MSDKFDLKVWWKTFNRKNTYVLSLGIFIVTTVIYLAQQPALFEEGIINRLLTSNFRTWLPVILLAIGQTIVMIGGGLDLAAGSMVSLGNVILALTITTTEEPMKNMLIVVGVLLYGIFAGFLNGVFTATLGLQPMITTFATSFIYSGLALLLLPNPGGAIPREYTKVYRTTDVVGIPLSLVIIGVVLLVWQFFKNRKFGRYLFAAGGSPNAAYTTGLRVTRIRISTYMISGFFASLAAISYSLLTGSGSAISGNEMTLTAITAAILGGTALSGGAGSLFGAVLGAIILGTFKNIISGARIDSWYQVLINALFIIVALAGPGFVNLIRGRYRND